MYVHMVTEIIQVRVLVCVCEGAAARCGCCCFYRRFITLTSCGVFFVLFC